MSTSVRNESADQGTTGAGSGAVSGAATGAAAGAMVGGPIGAVVGGVIGGVVGFVSGSRADEAAMYAKIAYKYNRQRSSRNASIQARDQVRQMRFERAAAMMAIGNEEGGQRSSAPQGALSSLGAQFAFNRAYLKADYYLQKQVEKYTRKAGRKQASANELMATFNSVASAVSSFGKPNPAAPSSTSTTAIGAQTAPYSTGWRGDTSGGWTGNTLPSRGFYPFTPNEY